MRRQLESNHHEAAVTEPEELGPPPGDEDPEEKNLTKQVHQALAQCAMKVSEKLTITELPDMVEVPSDDEEKRRLDSKRLRSTSPPKADGTPNRT